MITLSRDLPLTSWAPSWTVHAWPAESSPVQFHAPSSTACCIFVAGLSQVRPELSPEDEENGAQPRPDCRVMSTGDEQTPRSRLGWVLENEGNADCSDGLKLILLLLLGRFSFVRLFETPPPPPMRLVAHQPPLSIEFSRQEYWSVLPDPLPGNLHNPGIEPGSPALQENS